MQPISRSASVRAAVVFVTAQWLAFAAGAPQTVTWRLADASGAALDEAVVSLQPLDATGAPPPPLLPSPEIIQRDRIFVPYVTAITVGTAVIFPNRDNVQHHVYSLSRTKRFEIPLYGREAPREILFDQPGVVALGCNIHDWMLCYVVVLATPYFAKSDADGIATIAAVPPGRYRAEIWHPRLPAPVDSELVVAAERPPDELRPALKLKPDRRVRVAPAPDASSDYD